MFVLSIYLCPILPELQIKMSTKIFFSILISLFVFQTDGSGQEAKIWTLLDCVSYAYENNIMIKQQGLNTNFNENTLKQSRINQAPNVNASVSHSYTQGRSLNEATYLYTTQDQNASSFNINSSVTLFSGLQQRNTIKQNEYTLLAGLQDVEKLKNDISVNIALSYLQILLNKELLEITNSQIEVTYQQIIRTEKLVEAGSLPEGNLLEINAQAAREEMQVISGQNQLDISYLTLTQILDLDSAGGFDIEVPDLSSIINEDYIISPVDVVYRDALNIMPEIKGAEFRLKSSEQELKIAKGARSPSFSLNGSWGTVYSDARSRLVFDPGTGNISQEFYPFWDQLNDSRNWGINLGMYIPVFNGWMINTGISNARLNIVNFQYELKNTRNLLYKEIQQAHADASAALKKFRASETAVASMKEAFRYTEHKFNVGLLNSVDYSTSKNQLTQAQSELLQAKYEYVFYINVLEFYRGKPIEF